jgi:hypothetical protein
LARLDERVFQDRNERTDFLDIDSVTAELMIQFLLINGFDSNGNLAHAFFKQAYVVATECRLLHTHEAHAAQGAIMCDQRDNAT